MSRHLLLLVSLLFVWSPVASAQTVHAAEALSAPDAPVLLAPPRLLLDDAEAARDTPALPRHPVGAISAGIPLTLAGGALASLGLYGASQPGCSGGWFCIDLRGVSAVIAGVGGVAFLVGVGLLIGGGVRWADVDRERGRLQSNQAGGLVLDARGVGVRF